MPTFVSQPNLDVTITVMRQTSDYSQLIKSLNALFSCPDRAKVAGLTRSFAIPSVPSAFFISGDSVHSGIVDMLLSPKTSRRAHLSRRPISVLDLENRSTSAIIAAKGSRELKRGLQTIY